MHASNSNSQGVPSGTPLVLPLEAMPDNVALYSLLHNTPAYQQNNQGLAVAQRWLPLVAECHSVLEVGCGNGKLCHALAQNGKCVTGVDLVQGPYQRPGYEFLVMDVAEQQLSRDYEAALCFDVLEHIATDNVARVLRNIEQSAPILIFTIAGYGSPPHHLTVKSPGWWLNSILQNCQPRQWLVDVFQRYEEKPSNVYLFMGTPQ
jgi:SAM-dependent methyltransferase